MTEPAGLMWLTHPNLTPAHDFKGFPGAWTGSGWMVREDQSDPPPEVDETPTAPPEPTDEPDESESDEQPAEAGDIPDAEQEAPADSDDMKGEG